MLLFWSAAILLVVVAYSLFIPVLRGANPSNAVPRWQINRWIHAQRRQELLAEAAADPELSTELDRDLLHDLNNIQARLAIDEAQVIAATRREDRLAVFVSLIVLPVLALGLYLQLGHPDLLDATHTSPSPPMSQEELLARIEQLAEKMRQEPANLEGWLLLGRSYQGTNQMPKAVAAFEHALQLAPDNADVKILYAQALAEISQGSLQGKPAQLIDDVLRVDPNHPNALWMAGLAAAERHDANQAITYWQKLLSQLTPGSEEATELQNYMQRLQGGAAAAQQDASSVKPGLAIRVKVNLANDLRKEANPDDTVFIFARATQGPPMPLAIVRKQAKELPVEIVLDDSMAMVPGRTLSAVSSITLGARVSKSGQAKAMPGDLQGISAPIQVKNGQTYTVQISERVR